VSQILDADSATPSNPKEVGRHKVIPPFRACGAEGRARLVPFIRQGDAPEPPQYVRLDRVSPHQERFAESYLSVNFGAVSGDQGFN
jgi:hypothetical protein